MLRVVVDTSVLISAIRSGNGAAAELIRLAVLRRFVLLMDYKLACEYREIALRPSHLHASGKTAEEAEAIVDALEAVAEPVLVEMRYRPLSRDMDDDMVLDVAINGSADLVVTNNVKDFAQAARSFGVRVLSAGECLTAFREVDKGHAGESAQKFNQ